MRHGHGREHILVFASVALRLKWIAMRFSVTHGAAPQGTAIGIRARRIKLLAVMVSLNC